MSNASEIAVPIVHSPAGPAAARLHQRRAAAWTPWLIVVGLACVGVPLVIAAWTGNLAIPHNDAWSMSRITATFARTGQIRLLDWNDMNLIGQVVMLGPLGSSLVTQQLAVAGLSLACLFCAYRLMAVSLRTRDALLGVLLVGVWPGWASLSTSFETDVPAFAATFAAVLLGRRALLRDSRGWLAAALLVSIWAVSIREQAIVAPIAILGYGLLTGGSRRRLGVAALCVAGAGVTAALVGFEVWRWSLPLGQNPSPSNGIVRFAGDLFACGARAYLTLAIPLAPAVLIAAARHRWVRRDGFAVAAGLLVVGLGWLCGGVVGHYLWRSGEYAQVLPGTRIVLPSVLWFGVLVVGSVSGTVAIAVARGRWRSVDPLLGLFTALAAAEIVAVGAAGNGVYDRYLPVLVPGTVALLLARPRAASGRPARVRARHTLGRAWRAGAVVALIVTAVTSGLLAANAFAFDAARWHAAERLVSAGVPAGRIAAGLEWTGWHARDGMTYGDGQAARPGGWALAFGRLPACVVLSPSQLGLGSRDEAGWTPAGSDDYRTFLVSGSSRLYLYRTRAAGCPA